MVQAVIGVGARRGERVLIRTPRRAAVRSATRWTAELAAIPRARIARGGMRGWATVGPLHRRPDLHRQGGRGKREILDGNTAISRCGRHFAGGAGEEQRE